MSQQTVDSRNDLIDLSGLSLRDLDGLDRSAIAHALSEILDPATREGDVIAGFDSRLSP